MTHRPEIRAIFYQNLLTTENVQKMAKELVRKGNFKSIFRNETKGYKRYCAQIQPANSTRLAPAFKFSRCRKAVRGSLGYKGISEILWAFTVYSSSSGTRPRARRRGRYTDGLLRGGYENCKNATKKIFFFC